jgi:hypothetical protein
MGGNPVDACFLEVKHPIILKDIHPFESQSLMLYLKNEMVLLGSARGRGQRIHR